MIRSTASPLNIGDRVVIRGDHPHAGARTMNCLKCRRIAYAMYLVRCADTVTLLTPEEVQAIVDRAMAGEFDADLHGA